MFQGVMLVLGNVVKNSALSSLKKAPFVYSISDSKQNAKSFLSHVADSTFYALSHGSLGFALHGRFFNHFPIGQSSLIVANQNL